MDQEDERPVGRPSEPNPTDRVGPMDVLLVPWGVGAGPVEGRRGVAPMRLNRSLVPLPPADEEKGSKGTLPCAVVDEVVEGLVEEEERGGGGGLGSRMPKLAKVIPLAAELVVSPVSQLVKGSKVALDEGGGGWDEGHCVGGGGG